MSAADNSDNKFKILLIDGTESIARSLRTTVAASKSISIEVIWSADLPQALNLLKDVKIDMVLLDLTISNCRGIDAYRKLEQKSEHLPIVIVARAGDDYSALEAVEAGAQGVVTPVQIEHPSLILVLIAVIRRKKKENQIREVMKTYDLAIRGSRYGLWDWKINPEHPADPESRLWYCDRFVEMFGFERSEFSDKLEDLLARLHLNDKVRFMEAIQDHLIERMPFDVQCRFCTKSEEYRWFRIRGQAVWDERGQPLRMAGSLVDIHARKIADKEAAQAQQQYRTIFENSAVGITMTDENERIISWNRFTEKLLGYTREELYLKPIRDLYPKSEWRRMQSLNIRKKGVLEHLETKMVRKDGSALDIDISVTILKTSTDGKTGSIGIFSDITERKQAEQKIKLAEKKYRTIFDNSAVAITMTDEKERIISWNRFTEKLTGLSGTELHLKPVKELYPPEEWSRMKAIGGLRNKGILDNFETRILHKEGMLIDIDVSITVLTTEDGGKTGSIGIFRDISQRKQAERQLKLAEEKYRTIFDLSPVAIAMCDNQGQIMSWNKFTEKLLGVSGTELFRKPVRTLFSEEQWKRLTEQNLLKQGGVEQFETQVIRKDGSNLEIEISITVLKDADGAMTGSIGIFTDITERKRSQEALSKARAAAERANQSKSEFLANMSHEIRTPMNGIIGMTDILLDTELNPDQKDYAVTIKNSADALLSLINDVLDFSKIEAGKLTLDPLSFDLHLLIEELAAIMAIRAQENGIDLLMRYDPMAPHWIVGDPVRIRQILMNLTGNAIKFTEKGHVLINVHCRLQEAGKAYLHFTVKDTGIGIKQENIGHIFEKFMQEDASTTRRYGGTGLGLSICRELVSLMGGSIGVESKAGTGSTFWMNLTLPVAEGYGNEESMAEELKGLRVLIVDDNGVNQKILAEQVSSHGMHSDTLSLGKRAPALLETAVQDGKPYDVVLLDYQMPDINGDELARQIRSTPGIANIILILISSIARRGDLQRFSSLQLDGYIAKPVRKTSLINCILKAIQARASRQGGKAEKQGKLHEAAVQKTAKAEHLSAGMTGRPKLRVLLVEDNLTNLKVAQLTLAKLNCDVETAHNGLEAVEKARQNSYDAILMDCQMPEMDGYEAAEIIRRESTNGKRVPIIALTAHIDPSNKTRCLQAGMDDLLIKPAKRDDLLQMLLKWTGSVPQKSKIDACVQSAQDHALESRMNQVLNQSRLRELQEFIGEDDAGTISNLFKSFYHRLEQGIDETESAFQRKDKDGLLALAHELKGSAINLGAEKLAGIFESLETAAKKSQFEKMQPLISAVRNESLVFQQAYQKHFRLAA